ncbi:MAG: sugar transferase [Ktedonobacterales bacterium]
MLDERPELGNVLSFTAMAADTRRGERQSLVGVDTAEPLAATARIAGILSAPHAARDRLAALRLRRVRLREALLALDLGAALLALALAAHAALPAAWMGSLLGVPLPYVVLAGAICIVWPPVLSLCGSYRESWRKEPLAPLSALLGISVATLLTRGALQMAGVRLPYHLMLIAALWNAALVIALRLVLRLALPRRLLTQRVLVVGGGASALAAARSVAAARRSGLELAGVFGPGEDGPRLVRHPGVALAPRDGLPWSMDDADEVPRMVRELEADVVLLALGAREAAKAQWMMSGLASLPARVYLVPDVGMLTARPTMETLGALPVIGLTECALPPGQAHAKRALDVLLAGAALLLIWPVLLAIAAAIRLNSRGPALFAQERIGQHNRRFTIYKFRTMYVDAERRAAEVSIQTANGLVHKRRGDPRITRVGAVLRRTSLDELPQLFNVLRGEMSLVGPRPELPWLAQRYRSWQYGRLQAPQGITGWWQVHGRSDRVLHLHTEDDIYYVRNASLWLDLKILALTVKAVLSGRGAY